MCCSKVSSRIRARRVIASSLLARGISDVWGIFTAQVAKWSQFQLRRERPAEELTSGIYRTDPRQRPEGHDQQWSHFDGDAEQRRRNIRDVLVRHW